MKLNLRRNMQKAYGLVSGQYSTALQSYIKGLEEYIIESATNNIICLLKELKKATSGVDSKAKVCMNMQDAIICLNRMKKGSLESNEDYQEHFISNVTAVELTKGNHTSET